MDNTPSFNEFEESIIIFNRATISSRLGSGAIDIMIVLILAYLIPTIGAFAGVGYYLFKDALPFMKGQSLGKKVFQLRVQNRFDDSSITKQFGISFTRSLPIFIPFLNLIEVILILFKKRRFGDQWAETCVVIDNFKEEI